MIVNGYTADLVPRSSEVDGNHAVVEMNCWWSGKLSLDGLQ